MARISPGDSDRDKIIPKHRDIGLNQDRTERHRSRPKPKAKHAPKRSQSAPEPKHEPKRKHHSAAKEQAKVSNKLLDALIEIAQRNSREPLGDTGDGGVQTGRVGGSGVGIDVSPDEFDNSGYFDPTVGYAVPVGSHAQISGDLNMPSLPPIAQSLIQAVINGRPWEGPTYAERMAAYKDDRHGFDDIGRQLRNIGNVDPRRYNP